MLLVADEGCSGAALCRPLAERLEGRRAEVLVVAPALISATRYLDSDVDAARDAAELRLVETLAAFEARGIEVRGEVGSESPLEAIAGALTLFAARVAAGSRLHRTLSTARAICSPRRAGKSGRHLFPDPGGAQWN